MLGSTPRENWPDYPNTLANINRTHSLKDKAQMEGSSRHGAVPDGKDNHNSTNFSRDTRSKKSGTVPFLQNLSPILRHILANGVGGCFSRHKTGASMCPATALEWRVFSSRLRQAFTWQKYVNFF
nr:putative integron gene cassette protein [uncultured bacterium]